MPSVIAAPEVATTKVTTARGCRGCRGCRRPVRHDDVLEIELRRWDEDGGGDAERTAHFTAQNQGVGLHLAAAASV